MSPTKARLTVLVFCHCPLQRAPRAGRHSRSRSFNLQICAARSQTPDHTASPLLLGPLERLASRALRDLSLDQGLHSRQHVSLRRWGVQLTTGFGQGDAMRQQPPVLCSLN